MLRKFLVSLAVLFIVFSAVSGWANTTYSFSTGTTTSSRFGGSASVSGTFLYNPLASPAALPEPDGSQRYVDAMLNLTGSVAGYSFSDPNGRVFVANDKPAVDPHDFFTLNADSGTWPGGSHNITGFQIGGYQLVNVRLFWLEGQLGITDFLSNQNLPAVLPTFQGRLALDFVPIGSTAPVNYNDSVFFDGLYVSAVPEPGTMLLLGLGLIGVAGVRRFK